MGLVQYFEWRHFRNAKRKLHEYFGKETLALTIEDGTFIAPSDESNRVVPLNKILVPVTTGEIIDVVYPELYGTAKLVLSLPHMQKDASDEPLQNAISYAFFFSAIEYAMLHNLQYNNPAEPNENRWYNKAISKNIASLTGLFLANANTAYRDNHSIRPERWDFRSIFHYATVMMSMHCKHHNSDFDDPVSFRKIKRYLPCDMTVGSDFENIMLQAFKDRFVPLRTVQHLLEHQYGPGILMPIEKDKYFIRNIGSLPRGTRIMDYIYITEHHIYPIDITTALQAKYDERLRGRTLQTSKETLEILFNTHLREKLSLVFDGCTVNGVLITHTI